MEQRVQVMRTGAVAGLKARSERQDYRWQSEKPPTSMR